MLKYATVVIDDDGTPTYACKECGKTFEIFEAFRQHYKHVHLKLRKKTFSCVLCPAELLPWLRAKHMEEEHGWKAPTCGVCDKKFAYPNQLDRHTRFYHMGEPIFQCKECGKKFLTLRKLRLHSYSHSDVRDVACEFCPKTFKNLRYQQMHMRIHLNDKRYACHVCMETFVQWGNLKYHMTRHHPGRLRKENKDENDKLICNVTTEEDGSKTFTCLTCSNTFKQRQYFRLHYKHVHLKQRPKTRPCTICGAQLTPHKHARHLEQVHGKPAPSCGACGKKFSFPFEVIRHHKTFHMGEKHFQCDKCSMTFSHKKNLNLHIMKHQDIKKFKCKLCGKAFKWRNNLTEHEKTHVKIKKHICSICEAAFVKHRSLQHHVKLRHPEAM